MHRALCAVLGSTLLAVCSTASFADTVSVTGNVSFTRDSLTFAPPFATQNDTGMFAGFNGGTVNYLLGTVEYIYGLPQTVQAFNITDTAGNVLAFYDEVNSPVESYDAAGNLSVALNETGYYTLNGGTAMAGYFNVLFTGTSPDGSAPNVPFLGTGGFLEPTLGAAVAPEPGSILLLGTGILGAALVMRRRHQQAL